jgi:hypothetical protein
MKDSPSKYFLKAPGCPYKNPTVLQNRKCAPLESKYRVLGEIYFLYYCFFKFQIYIPKDD